ncbi:hypothetical protein CW702_00560 [Candidatus Bathyarchaeota archaeon]|nr:MAG: hypothetical protein CW702_00560 [Candidatus Bathyarchaeota archaeon]
MLGGAYKIKQGAAKTHDLLFYFHSGGFEESRCDTYHKLINAPPLAVAPPSWYCESKALGDISSFNEEKFRVYEKIVKDAFRDYIRLRERGKEYGMLNFGDWYGERGANWGNMEYDTPTTSFYSSLEAGI